MWFPFIWRRRWREPCCCTTFHREDRVCPAPPAALGLTFVIALGTSLFAVALLQMGLRYRTPPRRRFFPLLEPLFGSLCGILWLGRRLRRPKSSEAFLILAGVTLLAILRFPAKREEKWGLTDQRDRSRIGEKKNR